MALLNYTTKVPVSRTVAEIQNVLVAAKARSIMANYDDQGKPTGLAFAVDTGYGVRQFMLPVGDVARVLAVLKRDKVPPPLQTSEQAARVAWRILKDWLEAQMAIIATDTVTLDQVMLPYMTDGGRTVYDLYVDRQHALGPGDSA